MNASSSADGSTGSAEPVEDLAQGQRQNEQGDHATGRVWATGVGTRSLWARWLSPSGAAFAGKRR
jgi:hypothetical protein